MAKKLGHIICILDDDEPLVLRGNCPNIQQHTPEPEGYNAWHSWAAQMSKTHTQRRCPSCRLWAIWEPKQSRKKAMSYHDRIMMLPSKDSAAFDTVQDAIAYKSGHRDARHAAAEIATEADTLIRDLVKALDPDALEAIADEVNSFEHSARAESLRVIARKQRAALASAKEKGFE